jgi:hypothetical protein
MGLLLNNELESVLEEIVMDLSAVYLNICFEGLRKTMKSIVGVPVENQTDDPNEYSSEAPSLHNLAR